jgi:hypothetical protein
MHFTRVAGRLNNCVIPCGGIHPDLMKSGRGPGLRFITRLKAEMLGIRRTRWPTSGAGTIKHIPRCQTAGPLTDSIMQEVNQVGEKYTEKNKKGDNQKGFDQGRHGGVEAFAFDHSVDYRKHKHQQRQDK